MKKTKIFAFVILLVIVASLAFAVQPSSALQIEPPGKEPMLYSDFTGLVDLLAQVLSIAALLIFSAVTNSTGIEITKDLSRRLAQLKALRFAAIDGYGVVILNFLAAALLVYGYDVTFVGQFEVFKSVSPELLKIMETAILIVSQMASHKSGLPAISFKSVSTP